MSWSTSELRVRLAPLNRFKPSSKIFYWPFQGGTSFVDLLCFCSVLCLLCFVRVCLYVLCGHLLGKGWPLGSRLWCLLWVCHFPIGILGQVWYLIVSIPDLCNLITLMWEFHLRSWEMCTSRYLIWGTEERVWPWSAYLCMTAFLFVVMWMTWHNSWWKYIGQSDSHLCRLLRSSLSLVQSEELWIVRYRRVSSAKILQCC